MRRLILVLSPLSVLACYSAHAQGSAQQSAPPAAAYQGGRTTTSGWVTRPLEPENCGTPDDPRPCPPMPRHPLPYFPPHRHQ